MADNAAAQLRRILAVIPELADDQEHPLEAVASKLGIDSATLLRDLESLATRFDEPGGFVEGVQLYLGGETVSLVSNHFRRPMRPTVSELRAVELGLAMLRTEVPPDERSCIESAREKLRKTIAKLPADQNLDATHYAESENPASAARLSALRDAFRSHQKVNLEYRKADTEEITNRIIRPYSFVVSNGAWYVFAYCEASEGLRIFRLDRIAGVTPRDEEYEIPESFHVSDVLSAHKAFAHQSAPSMKVRYSPRIARWIAEREEGETASDGSFVVEHPLADPDWAVRHVLQYGPEAEVLEPESVRAAVKARLIRAAAALKE
jgi:predicted DNA-binding transcriptional regulator YafY